MSGKKHINVGLGFTTGRYCRLEAHGSEGMNIIIGNNCQINDSVHIAAAESVLIGDDVLIASRVFITDLNHGSYSGVDHSHPDSICRERALHTKPVVIESNVWLGKAWSYYLVSTLARPRSLERTQWFPETYQQTPLQ